MSVAKSILETEALLDVARSTGPVHRQLLTSLRDRGPGLTLEIAVRVFLFPDEIAKPLQELRDKGLVQARSFSGGPMGSEILSLTRRGEQVVDLLRDEAMAGQLDAMQVSAQETVQRTRSAAPDPRQQEAELLRKLGDLAEQSGDAEQAADYYRQALLVTRSLPAMATGGGASD